MDRVAVMQVFARVAETGSFTKAAESLGVSRATVSVAIRRLEESLGVRLLHRTTRRVSLTSEGRLYHERARDLLERLEAAEQLFRGGQTHLTGRLTINAPTRIARRIILPALPEFLSQHPRLEFRLGASDRSIDLVEVGVDAVVRVGQLRDSSHVVRSLGSLAQINCASPKYIARYGHPQRLDELTAHQVVAYSPTLSGGASWDYLEKSGETRSLPMRSVVTVDTAETYIDACLAGLGLIQVPAYDVRHHLASGALVSVLPRHTAPALPISVLYPSRRHVPKRLKTFNAWIAMLVERQGMLS